MAPHRRAGESAESFPHQLNPPPPLRPHKLIGCDLAAEVFGIEGLGAILVEHGKFRKFNMHTGLTGN